MDDIIDAILGGVGAKVVCSYLGMCLADVKATERFSFDSGPEIDDCSVCEFAMGLLKDLVGENVTEVGVVAVVVFVYTNVCF